MPKDSFSKRYFFKLTTNLLGFFIGIVSQAIVPRSLGPGSYGDFSFLTNFFSQIIGFFDMGSASCFYTKLSQRPKEYRLVSFYLYFMGLAGICVLVFVGVVRMSGAYSRLWPGEELLYVYMSLFLALVIWVSNIMNQMTDAYGLTVSAETGKIMQKFAALLVLILLFASANLNLFTYFLYNFAAILLLILVFMVVLRKNGYDLFRKIRLSLSEARAYVREFYSYCHPLVLYSVVTVIVGIFDRWLLQVCGGSIQQGFFGLSDQIGLACFLFTGAMTPLIMREFSVTYASKDIKAMKEIFRRNVPFMYSITAFISCFMAVNADKVTLIMGGSKFTGAVIPVALMVLFPMVRTYSQLTSAVFYATGKTRLYSNIVIATMLAGVPITYFLIAPKRFFGMEAGAIGLAVKTLVTGFVTVNVLLYFNVKFLNLAFWKYVAHQIASAVFLLAIAIIAGIGVSHAAVLWKNQIVISFLFSGAVYTAIVAVCVYIYPGIFALTKNDIKRLIRYPLARTGGNRGS